MDAKRYETKGSVKASYKKSSLMNKTVAILAAAFFIFSGIPAPTSFADTVPITLNDARQQVPVVTLEQANAQSAPARDQVPTGSAIQNPGPLSASNGLSVPTTLPPGAEPRGSSPDGKYKIYYWGATASARYFIVTDKNDNELWRFDAQGGPYNSIVSYNITNDGVYVLRKESGILKIKFGDFNKRQLLDAKLPSGVPLTAETTVQFVSGTHRANIDGKLVDLKVGLEVRGLSPNGEYQVFYKPITAIDRHFVVMDKNYNELWNFEVQGYDHWTVSYNVTNGGVYLLKKELENGNYTMKIKFADFSLKTVRDIPLPGGLSVSNIASIRFVKGTDEAYIVTRIPKKKMLFNLKTGICLKGCS